MAARQIQGKQPTKEKKAVKKAELKLADMMPAELAVQAKDLRGKIAAANLERTAGKAKNMRLTYTLRKQLARTLTMLKSKGN